MPPYTIWDRNPVLFALMSYRLWLIKIVKNW